MELVLKGALLAGGLAVFFVLLRAGANRPAKRDPETGELVLQNSSVLVWSMGIIAVAGPVLMAVLSFVIPFQNTAQVFVPIGLGAFFLLLGGLMCLWAIRRRTRVGERGLTSEYVFARPRFLPWEEVVKVSFANGQEFWVHGSGRQKAMLHVWFVGVKEAVPLLRQHLPEEVRRKYDATLATFAAAVGAS
jgi:Bacterial PH domain